MYRWITKMFSLRAGLQGDSIWLAELRYKKGNDLKLMKVMLAINSEASNKLYVQKHHQKYSPTIGTIPAVSLSMAPPDINGGESSVVVLIDIPAVIAKDPWSLVTTLAGMVVVNISAKRYNYKIVYNMKHYSAKLLARSTIYCKQHYVSNV